jgi:hypothetical protein
MSFSGISDPWSHCSRAGPPHAAPFHGDKRFFRRLSSREDYEWLFAASLIGQEFNRTGFSQSAESIISVTLPPRFARFDRSPEPLLAWILLDCADA